MGEAEPACAPEASLVDASQALPRLPEGAACGAASSGARTTRTS